MIPGIVASTGPGASTPAVPHRYWRLYMTANNGSDISSVLEVEMQESEFGPNLCQGGVAAASSSISGLSPADAFDGSLRDLTTIATQDAWASSGSLAPPHWLSYDFGVGNEKAIKVIGIHGRQEGFGIEQMPNDFEIQWSDDNVSWTTAWAEADQVWAPFEFKKFINPAYAGESYTGSPWGDHLYWRVVVMRTTGSGVSAAAIAEVEFRATPSGADQATGGVAVADAVFGSGFEADKAFDNNNATLWSSTDKGSVNFGWIRYQFPAPVSVAEVMLRARSDGFHGDTEPKIFAVQCSDSATGPWTTVLSEINEPGWASGEVRVFTDPNYIAP